MAKKNEEKNDAMQKTEAPGALQVYDYGDDYDAGEYSGREDMLIPFISLLQANSKVVVERQIGKAGDLMNSVTEDVFDGKSGVVVIPVHKTREYVEWRPLDQGGGLVDRHDVNSAIVRQAKENAKDQFKLKTDAGNDLVETHYLHAILDDGKGGLMPVVIPFSKTKIKIWQGWNSKRLTFQVQTPDGRKKSPPLYANETRLNSFFTKSPKGQPYHNFQMKPANGEFASSLLSPDDPRYAMAKAHLEMLESGRAKMDFESYAKAEASDERADDGVTF